MTAHGPAPYFQLDGTARQALDRWQTVFGGAVRIATYADFSRTDGPADAVAHGQLAGDIELFAADAAPGESPFAASGVLFSLLGAAEPDVLRRWFDDLASDGTVVDALQERPWGDWDGIVRDVFGVTWLIGFEASALVPRATDLPTVLFVCVHNAGRSQMAAGWLQHLAGDRVRVLSAGSEPADQVNAVAVQVMAEVGIDIASAVPAVLETTTVQESDVVITMGCGDACPVFPGKRYEDWDLEDPAGQGPEVVRRIRDDVRARVEALVATI